MNLNVSKRLPLDATLVNASSKSFCFFVGSIFTKPLHRYFAVMYLRLSSKFESGFNFFQPLCSPDSQTVLLTLSFPPKFTIICICVTGIESISNDLIFDTATPSDLCIPLHACMCDKYELRVLIVSHREKLRRRTMQTETPRFKLNQVGLVAPQSAQRGDISRSLR